MTRLPSIRRTAGSSSTRARAVARQHINHPYIGLPNYYNNWLRHGFQRSDLADGGSDRLVDALVAWGDAETVAAKLVEHFQAGADHVALQVITEDPQALPMDQWRELAGALKDRAPQST
jgi:probable F420-dependent oxidoreductase